jgi:hypothetical protein
MTGFLERYLIAVCHPAIMQFMTNFTRKNGFLRKLKITVKFNLAKRTLLRTFECKKRKCHESTYDYISPTANEGTL